MKRSRWFYLAHEPDGVGRVPRNAYLPVKSTLPVLVGRSKIDTLTACDHTRKGARQVVPAEGVEHTGKAWELWVSGRWRREDTRRIIVGGRGLGRAQSKLGARELYNADPPTYDVSD